MNYNVPVDEGMLPNGKRILKLSCRESFCFLYDSTPVFNSIFKRASSKIKASNNPELDSIENLRVWNHSTFSICEGESLESISKIFDQNNLDLDVRQHRAALVRGSNSYIDASIWMEAYFDSFCYDPTSKQIHIDATYKTAIYDEYVDECRQILGNDQNVISEPQFTTLWKQLYNNVKIRKLKRVSGKCWTCAYIHELRNLHKGPHMMEALKQLMIMHRGGYFMLERIEYRKRVRESIIVNPNSVMSCIIDGASQNHCTIPHVGVSAEFQGLEQHIEGVITHGHGFTIYRSYPTVKSDSDFIIYCLLSELKKWRDRHEGQYPETWFIQIDGGCENANKYLHAMLELLVAKRVCKKIVLTR
jgi:hypothetical protein